MAVVITGSGTEANEAVFSSVVPQGGRVLVITNGEFGERLARISQLYNETIVISHNWASPFDLKKIEAMIEQQAFALVAVVHHETSTGMINPIAEIGEICRTNGKRFFVDMVSSFSADPIDLGQSCIDFLSFSAGKAIGSYPGVSGVIGRRSEWQAITGLPERSHYLSLSRHLKFAEEECQTPNTPALPLIIALNKALELIIEEGRASRHLRLRTLAKYMRDGLSERGFQCLAEDQPRSCTLTNVLVPQSISFEALSEELQALGFAVYGGKGPLADKVFQVSTIGQMDKTTIDHFLEALTAVCDDRSEALQRSVMSRS